MLVIHCGKDYRVSLNEGLSSFNVLQLKGIPSKFLFFPMENHWAVNPHNQIKWYPSFGFFWKIYNKIIYNKNGFILLFSNIAIYLIVKFFLILYINIFIF